MAKKDFLAFRIDPELKQQIEAIAAEEQRSISQICELFLKGAVEDYKKDGPQFIQRLLAGHKHKKSNLNLPRRLESEVWLRSASGVTGRRSHVRQLGQ